MKLIRVFVHYYNCSVTIQSITVQGLSHFFLLGLGPGMGSLPFNEYNIEQNCMYMGPSHFFLLGLGPGIGRLPLKNFKLMFLHVISFEFLAGVPPSGGFLAKAIK